MDIAKIANRIASDFTAKTLDDHDVTDALFKLISPTLKRVIFLADKGEFDKIKKIRRFFDGRVIDLKGLRMTDEEREIYKGVSYSLEFMADRNPYWAKHSYHVGNKEIIGRYNVGLPAIMDWNEERSKFINDVNRADLSLRHEVTHALRDAVTGHLEKYRRDTRNKEVYESDRGHIEIEFEIDAIINSFERLKKRTKPEVWDELAASDLMRMMPGLRFPNKKSKFFMIWVKRLMREDLLTTAMIKEWRLSSKYRASI